MAKLDAFRKLIREELRLVIKEELPKILVENKNSSKYTDTFKSSKTKEKPPMTLNTQAAAVPAPVTKNGLLNTLLSETATSMRNSDMISFSSNDADGFALMQNSVDESATFGGGVENMLNSAKGGGVHEMVQINHVPDFSALMDDMINKGKI